MQMHSAGASVSQIRSAIEGKYRSQYADDDPDITGAAGQVNSRPGDRTTPYNRVVPDPELSSAAPPEAFARLFESVHEGVYIGTLSEAQR